MVILKGNEINRKNYQLLGVACLFIASKYNEIYPKDAKKFVYYCDGQYEVNDLFTMESMILNTVNFNLQFPTIINFTSSAVETF